ncbi:hypothetical protein [Microbacterium sp. NPDC089696]|uniref:hypothetical protein n=1 Tax=Microbacterium sp. NPDC089696 TaxID=3364199 RepID=UPI00381B433B
MADSKRKWTSIFAVVGTVVAAYVAFGAFMISFGGGWWAVALVPLLLIFLWLNQVYRPLGKGLSTSALRGTAVGLMTLFLISFSIPLLVVPRWLPAADLDGTDPQRTGCADVGDTVTSAQWPMSDTQTNAPVASALLKYSTACDTVWVKVEGVAVGTRTLTQVARPAGDWLWALTPSAEDDAPSDGIAYSKQIRSSGCTYVNVSLLNANGEVIAEINETSGCND